ncbi:T9SS type A sorting domain-containing protein [bacterium]|nr:T9SS type A sorting domain-containing protein [bacterium]
MSRRISNTLLTVFLLLFFTTSLSFGFTSTGYFAILGFGPSELVFQPLNGDAISLGELGTTPNVLRQLDDQLWIVHSGDWQTGEGSEVWHLSLEELSEAVENQNLPEWNVIELDNGSNPYDIAHINDNLFVSHLNTGEVVVLDDEYFEEVGRLTNLNSPQGLCGYGEFLAIAESGFGAGSTVVLVDPVSLERVDTLTVGINPQWFTTDKTSNLYILCSGTSWTAPPMPASLWQYNDSMEELNFIELEGYPGEIAMLNNSTPERFIVLGDEYAQLTPNISIFSASTLEEQIVEENLTGGYTMIPMLEGMLIGSSTTNNVYAIDSGFSTTGLEFTHENSVIDIVFVEGETEVADNEMGLPSTAILSPAYPNPFNSFARFSLFMPVAGDIEIELINSLGQKVQSIHSGTLSVGEYSMQVNATHFSAGSYFIRARVGDRQYTKQIVYVR